MNSIINELITKLETHPHKVITVEYVLSRLRESQRDEYSESVKIPVYDMEAFRGL